MVHSCPPSYAGNINRGSTSNLAGIKTRCYLKNAYSKEDWGMAQVEKRLPGKCKVLSCCPMPQKRYKKN
jgi:hypothetical protein